VNEMRYPLEAVPSPRADTVWAAAASLPRLSNQVARSVHLGSSARRALRHLERGLRLRTDVAFGSKSDFVGPSARCQNNR